MIAAVSAAVRHAVEHERAIAYGEVCGLTRGQAREVVDEWALVRRQTPAALDWAEVRGSMLLRAQGAAWRPALGPWGVFLAK